MVVDGERARVRSYLISQGDKLSVEDIWAKVDAAFGELSQSVAGTLNEAQLNFKPAPEEWSILEVMSHITSANIGTSRSMLRLASGVEPKSEAGSRRTATAADDMVALVAANREEVVRAVRELPASPLLEPTSPHSMFGPLNCKAWLLFIRLHKLDHAGQIKKNRDHENFPR